MTPDEKEPKPAHVVLVIQDSVHSMSSQMVEPSQEAQKDG
jgi:hypothetical protein